MTRFFFHILDRGDLVPDEQGMVLRDLDAARTEAFLTSKDLISAGASRDGLVEIADWRGRVLDIISIRCALH